MGESQTRRQFLKKAAYVSPVVLTLAAKPAAAGIGSGRGNNGIGQEKRGLFDGAPPGLGPGGDFNDNPLDGTQGR